MTTLTIKINERTKAGKAFMAMSESFFKDVKGIEIIEKNTKSTKEKSHYSPAFVKKILESRNSKDSIVINPNDIWGSLGLSSKK